MVNKHRFAFVALQGWMMIDPQQKQIPKDAIIKEIMLTSAEANVIGMAPNLFLSTQQLLEAKASQQLVSLKPPQQQPPARN